MYDVRLARGLRHQATAHGCLGATLMLLEARVDARPGSLLVHYPAHGLNVVGLESRAVRNPDRCRGVTIPNARRAPNLVAVRAIGPDVRRDSYPVPANCVRHTGRGARHYSAPSTTG